MWWKKKKKIKATNIVGFYFEKFESGSFDEPFPISGKDYFAMMIPEKPIKLDRHIKIFGWSCLFMRQWVGIKRWNRIVPVRQDKIFDFIFWRFVKSLNNNTSIKRSWSYEQKSNSSDEP